MDPIGASQEWTWNGYRNSWVDVNGAQVQSVPGGSHWGGGLFISALDHARVGLLIARNGRWGGKQILSQSWIDAMLSPSATNRDYGFLWWLNSDRKRTPAAPAGSVCALGAGNNYIWVDRERDLVVVVRWMDQTKFNGFAERVMAAVM